MQRKKQLEQEFQKATDSDVKMVIQDKLKKAEGDISYSKEEVKKWENEVNQRENRLQQLVTTKKEEGSFRTWDLTYNECHRYTIEYG